MIKLKRILVVKSKKQVKNSTYKNKIIKIEQNLKKYGKINRKLNIV